MMFSVSAVLVVLFACLTQATDPACSSQCFNDNTGASFCYDLSGLKKSDSDKNNFITGQESGQGWTLYLNICGDASAVGCTASTPVCQFDGASKYFSLGTPESWTMSAYYDPKTSAPAPSQGVVVKTTNGDICGNGVPRQTIQWYFCNPAVANLPAPSAPVNVAEEDPSNSNPTPCKYFFTPIPYQGFCPGAGGGSGGFDYGWVFVIIVLVGLFVYFVAGILICRFGQHKEGVEMIPQHEFWTALPGLVFDGMKYAFCCVPCRGGSYTSV